MESKALPLRFRISQFQNMKKDYLLIYIFCVALQSLSSQTTFNHQIDFGLPFVALTSILPTDSCFYATGVATDSLPPYKVGNIFVKFDLDGNVLFSKTLFNPNKWYETWSGDLITTPDGNLIDIGYTKDSIQKAILLKYNLKGDTLLTREYFNILYPEYDFIVPREIRKTKNGYAILFGHDAGFNGEISLMLLDSNFNTIQYTAYGTNFTERPQSLLVEEDGGFIIGASKTNWAQVDQNYFSRTYLLKVDSLGQIKWEYLNPTAALEPLRDRANAIFKTQDEDIIIASGAGIEYKVNASSGQLRWDGLVFKLDAQLNLKKEIIMRGVEPTIITEIKKMIEVSDGSGYIGVGRIGEDKTDGTFLASSWTVKVSPEGDSLWSRYYNYFDGFNSEPRPYDIKETPDGCFVIVGETKPLISPFEQLQRAWIMKVDSFGCLVPGCHIIDGLKEPEQNPIEVKLYPNPASDFLNIFIRSHRLSTKYDFRIVDELGKTIQVFQNRFPEETISISVGNFPSGTYFLQISENNLLFKTEKVIIQNSSK